MRICYVEPGIETAAGYCSHGLGMLSALTKQQGHESVWIHASVEHFPTRCAELKPDVVAVHTISTDFQASIDICRTAKECNPAIITAVGGPHPTYAPESYTDHPYVDFIFQGEGEVTWPILVDDLAKSGLEVCRSTSWSRVLRGAPPENLDALPFIDRYRWENRPESKHLTLYQPGIGDRMITMISSRVCHRRCKFCYPGSQIMFGTKMRIRSVDHFMAELDTLRPFDCMMIHDDNLLEPVRWLEEFTEKYSGEPFTCQGSADLILHRRELLPRLVAKGMRGMLVGFESFSDNVLNLLEKGNTAEQNIEAAKLLKSLHIGVQANLIVGVPGETREDIEATKRAMDQYVRPSTDSWCVLTPYPGSKLYQEAVERGWLDPATYIVHGRGAGGRPIPMAVDYNQLYEWLK